jgi:hypothetical protein
MAIEIYYSGAETPLGVQTEAFNSIGGYISSSKMPNGSSKNLFGDISYLNRLNKQSQYRLIVLKVVGDTTNIRVGIINNEPMSYSIQLGFISPNNQLAFEKLANNASKPLYTEMEGVLYMDDINDIVNLFTIGNKADGSYIGLWVNRNVFKSPTIENPCEHFSEIEADTNTTRGFNIIIRHD